MDTNKMRAAFEALILSDGKSIRRSGDSYHFGTVNRSEQSTNTSGFTGVTRHKKTGKWQAGIQIDGRHHHLGLFDAPEAASVARKDAEIRLGFHKNHGRSRP